MDKKWWSNALQKGFDTGLELYVEVLDTLHGNIARYFYVVNQRGQCATWSKAELLNNEEPVVSTDVDVQKVRNRLAIRNCMKVTVDEFEMFAGIKPFPKDKVSHDKAWVAPTGAKSFNGALNF